jgi:hypothetical protein
MDDGGGVVRVGGEVVAAAARSAAARSVAGRQVAAPYSRAVEAAVCGRLASGESLRAICSEPGMPHRSSVMRWMKKKPRFRAKIEAARAASGWYSIVGGRPPIWSEVTAQEIFARLVKGESLVSICDDPSMPGWGTVWKWRRDRPEFDRAVVLAREAKTERLVDQGMAIADAVTPEMAHATRVRLAQLRWTASCWMPGRYGRVKPLEAETLPREQGVQRVLLKSFRVEEREDGWTRVVTLLPDPATGRVVRQQPEGEWNPPLSEWHK